MIGSTMLAVMLVVPARAAERSAPPDDIVLEATSERLAAEAVMPGTAGDVVVDEVEVRTSMSFHAEAVVQAVVDARSTLTWDDDDGLEGRVTHAVRPLVDGGRVFVDAEVTMTVMFEVWELEGNGPPVASIPLRTAPAKIRLVSEPLTSFLLPGDGPLTLQTTAVHDVDLPLQIPASAQQLLSFVGDPPRWKGRPSVALTVGASALGRRASGVPIAADGLFEIPSPSPELRVAHDWAVEANLVVAADVHESVDGTLQMVGVVPVPLSFPTHQVSLPLVSESLPLLANTVRATHPLPQVSHPDEIDLGEQPAGSWQDHTATIGNLGSARLRFRAWMEDAPGLAVPEDEQVVGALRAVDLPITAAPLQPAEVEGTLVLATNAPFGKRVAIPVRLVATDEGGVSPFDPSSDPTAACDGCAAGGGAVGVWWLLLPLAWRRRRAV